MIARAERCRILVDRRTPAIVRWELRPSRSRALRGRSAPFVHQSAVVSANCRGYCCPEVSGAGISAEVGGAGAAFGQDLGDGALDGRGCGALAKMVKHHRTGPDLTDRVGDAVASDV